MEIVEYVRDLEIGNIKKYKNLAVAPILGNDSKLEHIVLSDALQEGLEIREKGSASVPKLFAVNRTGKNILAIAGEYIVGGMQNRTIVRNIYFDKEFEGEIPVKCVQQGRWSHSSDMEIHMPDGPIIPDGDVYPPYNPFPYDPRGPRFPRIPREPREPGRVPGGIVFAHGGHAPICASLMSDSQGETWNAVDKMLCCENVRSSSRDLNAVYKEKKQEFKNYHDKFPFQENQIGNLAVISKNGNRTFILDLFDRNEIAEKYYKNLLSSYALEAGLNSENRVRANKQELKGFLDSVDSCDFKSQNPVSVGEDYKIIGTNLKGSALVFENNLAYMNLFTRNKQNKPGRNNSGRNNPEINIPSGGINMDGMNRNPFSSGFYRVF